MDAVLYCAVIAILTDHASWKVPDTFFFLVTKKKLQYTISKVQTPPGSH